MARPGQLIISDATHEHVQNEFACRFAGEYQPKGISRPVSCYEVLGRKTDEDTTAA